MASTAAAVSSTGAAQYPRPIPVFGAVTGTRAPWWPRTSAIASASARSASGTPRASAKTTSTSSGAQPASRRACRIAWARPSRDSAQREAPVKVAPCPATTARTSAPRSRAVPAASSTSMAPPSAGTNPHAPSVNGR